jgi:hypothetical protein
MPPAPGLFSTMTVCPIFSVSTLAMVRAPLSVTPPGGNGTM